MKYTLLSPRSFSDYKLLDCGAGQKLEQFGKVKLIRPEPQAVWKPQLSKAEWENIAHARFISSDGQKGKWEQLKDLPSTWNLKYKSPEYSLTMQLKLTGFKHVGIFPEQSVQWDYIYRNSKRLFKPKVLNLFAYTGGATMAAKAAGADVIHCESLKQIVAWAKTNMELSKLKDVRWLVEDALKFLKREVKRGNYYDGVILDPPSYGIGPSGERFVLEGQLPMLVSLVQQVLKPKCFVVCNSYSFKFSALSLSNLFMAELDKKGQAEMGELTSPYSEEKSLSHGVFFRYSNLQSR